MKVVILCGGKGMRLREETEYRPKPLVLIGGMPILWHIMKIYSYYGFNEFILCLGYKGRMIKDYFLNFEEMTRDFTLHLRSEMPRVVQHKTDGLENWKITFVDTGEEENTGSRIAKIEPFVRGEAFCLTYGDGVADIDIGKLLSFHKDKGRIVTLTAVHPDSVYGILEEENGIVRAFREKKKTESKINGGFFVCEPEVFKYISNHPSCVFEQDPLQKLVKSEQLAAYDHNGFWYCMDTYKHFEDLNKRWDKGDAPWKIWN